MSDERKFAEDCLSAINEYRANHQVKPLTYNRDIEAVAREWADHIARGNTLEHNPDRGYKGTKLGENIAYQSRRSITGPMIAEQWYSEIKDYDFRANRGRGNAVIGHFTQVVWKDSKELGIARAQTRDGGWMIVADFYPPGNYNDDYANNVFPPRDGKIPTPTSKDERHHQRTDSHQHKAQIVSTSTKKNTSTVNGVTKTKITTTTIDENGVETIEVTETVES